MPDITMCSGINCPVALTCYRHVAKPSEFLQSYFAEPPFDKLDEKCDYYWPVQEEIDKIKKEAKKRAAWTMKLKDVGDNDLKTN